MIKIFQKSRNLTKVIYQIYVNSATNEELSENYLIQEQVNLIRA